MKDLSVIILSFNTRELTHKCVLSVLKSLDTDTSVDAEVIILDNASTDGSPDMLTSLRDQRVRIILSRENTGFSVGNNLAVKQAKGRTILLLNSDTEVVDDAIPALYRFLHGQKKFNIVGGKLLNKDGSPQPSCGRFYTLSIAFAALFLQADSWGLSRSSPSKVATCDWISGACIMMTTQTYNKLNGFDESIFMYWDEVDLLYRAHKKKFKVGFYPHAVFYHLEAGSSTKPYDTIPRVFKGYLLFYKKHYSPLHLHLLRYMLQLKALIVIGLATMFNKSDLRSAYRKAYEIAQKT